MPSSPSKISILGGHAIEASPAAAAVAAEIGNEFLANPLQSKPIGFYTWNEALAPIFQRDRLLQTELKPETSKVFAAALGGDPDLLARYQAALRLPARLTNGFAREALDGAAARIAAGKAPELEHLALLPPSGRKKKDTHHCSSAILQGPIPESTFVRYTRDRARRVGGQAEAADCRK